jgi:ADP-ribose pyrophosphatase YjhB (NUDIX family)
MAKSSVVKRAKGSKKTKVQFGALPWRLTPDGHLQILLISSRETRRPVIPKGWPIKGIAPNMTAMREAYEEAGIEGYISMTSVGSYGYVKHMPKGREQDVRVEVFGLQVQRSIRAFRKCTSEQSSGYRQCPPRSSWRSRSLRR